MHEGNRIELEITDIAFGGDGVGRAARQVVFVPFTMIGEHVEAEIYRQEKQFARARLRRVLTPSPQRIPSKCFHFGQCAGCQYQHIPYPTQCVLKTKQVRDVMERVGKFAAPPVRPILPSPLEYDYRSKINLHPRHIAAPSIQEAIRAGRTRAAGRGDIVYRANSKGQFFRQDLSNGAGDAEYVEWLGDIEFRLPMQSFFQNNIAMVPVMLEEVRKRVEAAGVRYLLDGYCGAGFFAVHLASKLPLDKVWGIEVDAQAIRYARENAARTGLSQLEFVSGPVESVLPVLLVKNRRVLGDTCVLLDPPRAGCERAVLESLARNKPKRIVYVSCDPATLARDLRMLTDLGFTLAEIQPLDMFPQTAHIECIAVLSVL
jgi:tRNA/tmRNA/rRNA uracil-C5-methylase (TrmA/RlmC/RlmD family)